MVRVFAAGICIMHMNIFTSEICISGLNFFSIRLYADILYCCIFLDGHICLQHFCV